MQSARPAFKERKFVFSVLSVVCSCEDEWPWSGDRVEQSAESGSSPLVQASLPTFITTNVLQQTTRNKLCNKIMT